MYGGMGVGMRKTNSNVLKTHKIPVRCIIKIDIAAYKIGGRYLLGLFSNNLLYFCGKWKTNS